MTTASISTPQPASRRGRRWIATLLLLMTSVIFTLLAAEGLFRLAAHRLAAEGEWFAAGHIMQDDDTQLGFSMLPHSSQVAVRGGAYTVRTSINALGMRDDEHPAVPRPGTRRVLVLGDSFMFSPGVSVADSMPRVLEGLTPGLEILNAGVPGYNLEQEYLYYLHRGRSLSPQLVLLAFFINDLAPAPAYEIARDADGLPLSYRARSTGPADRQATGAGLRGGTASWLRAHSLLYVFARKRLGGTRRAETAAPRTDAPRALPPELEAFRAGEPPPAAWAQAWRVLDALRAEVTRTGASLAVVMIPSPVQISDAAWSDWVRWLQEPPEGLDRRGPQRRLASWCAATATPCLDLLDAYLDVPVDRFYIRHDLHWTVEGHERAAGAVAAFLRAHGLAGT